MEKNIKVRVKFISFYNEILALFPDFKESDNTILSYQHIGQHSEADKSLMHHKAICDSRIVELWNELIQIGYEPTLY